MIVHLLSVCPHLANSAYLYRHNLIAKVVHCHLSKVFSLPVSSSSWFTYCTLPVFENTAGNILWNLSLISEGHHPNRNAKARAGGWGHGQENLHSYHTTVLFH